MTGVVKEEEMTIEYIYYSLLNNAEHTNINKCRTKNIYKKKKKKKKGSQQWEAKGKEEEKEKEEEGMKKKRKEDIYIFFCMCVYMHICLRIKKTCLKKTIKKVKHGKLESMEMKEHKINQGVQDARRERHSKEEE